MRILLVEDEPGLSEALKSILIKENYAVDLALDGVTGLDCALTGIYDVIILDIMLPEMNGIEVLKVLRIEDIKTPIIMLTAKTELEDKIVGLDAGADDYLTKPFHSGELLARIRAILRRKKEVRSERLTFGDLVLRQDTRELFCLEDSVKLAQKEFLLLETLMLNARQVVTKEQIYDKVWGYDNESEYNNVEVYVSFVRKKMNFINSKVLIKVNRGLGYFLDVE
ncbi:response regulator transcription factor [Eubacteriaceae bacterium ES3]|nr:response regulator transcription factor [Eubacteriaceae bacterium ES3]